MNLAKLLLNNNSLKKLDLTGNKMTGKAVKLIV